MPAADPQWLLPKKISKPPNSFNSQKKGETASDFVLPSTRENLGLGMEEAEPLALHVLGWE